MLVTCPACKTSHSRPEREVESGAPITCRRCGRTFRQQSEGSGEGAGGSLGVRSQKLPPDGTKEPTLRSTVPQRRPVPVPKSPKAHEIPTGILKVSALHEQLEQMRTLPDAPQPEVSAAPEPEASAAQEPNSEGAAEQEAEAHGERHFELGPIRQLAVEIRATLARAPLQARLAFYAILSLLVLCAVLPWLPPGANHQRVYLSTDEPLWAGPAAGEVYPQLATLPRGSAVDIYARVGSFALVVDASGRAGYLRGGVLSESLPANAPEQPFTDCFCAPVDVSAEPCQARARFQLEACRKECASRVEVGSCLNLCQQRFAACMRGCDSKAFTFSVVQPRPPSPSCEAPTAGTAQAVQRVAEPRPRIRRQKKKRGR